MFTSNARSLAALVSALALGSLAARAGALEPPPPSPDVVPPRLESDPGVSYPAQALEERYFQPTTVLLVIEIDAEGAVTKATVVEPRGHGFDEAAVAAARRLRFEPATRGGRAVAARIGFRYDFVPPPPRLDGRVATQAADRAIGGASVVVRDAQGETHETTTAEDGSWSLDGLPPGPVHVSASAVNQNAEEADETLSPGEETTVVLRLASPKPPVAVADEPVEEVTVRGTRPPREVTKRTLEAQEIARIPGTNGDALRSLQNLPGVGLPPLFSGQLIVRGSAPGDTNIFVDGTGIPIAYHFGGLSSVIPTEVIDKIDFYPGNYSAEYGRGMGGVVDVDLRDPKKDDYHALAQADLIDLRVLAEGPIAGGWTFLAAGRRSWFDLYLTPILTNAGAGVVAAPVYYDYQLMIQKDLDAHSSLRFLFLGSHDVLAVTNSGGGEVAGDIGLRTSFWRIQARYEERVSPDSEFRLTLAYGEDSFDATLGTYLVNPAARPLSGRGEYSAKVAPWLVANVGFDVLYEWYDLNLQLPPPTPPGVPPGGPGQIPIQARSSGTLALPAAYAELEVLPWRGARFVPGLRLDYDTATSAWDVAPRMTFRQDLFTGFPRTTLKAGAGLFYQPPTVFDTAPNYGQVGLVSNRDGHYDIGVEQEITQQVETSLDLFYKAMSDLVIAGSGNSGLGRAYGAELLFRYKPDDHFFGWMSYTLSRSERRSLPGQPFYLFQYDQTHILTLVGSYKLGRGWQVGLRFRVVSGDPYTPMTYGASNATVGSQLGVSAFPPNGSRLPFFNALDARVDKEWVWGEWKLGLYLDVENTYSAGNPFAISYNYNFTQSAYVNGLPILPILGIRGEFR